MSRRRSAITRVRARLERKLAKGWQRAVFASPRAADGSREERVVEGPGANEGKEDLSSRMIAERFAALMAEAEAAAREGLVKQTYVIDERRRVELDARHGHLKQRVLDEQTVAKIMGGKDRALRPDQSASLLRAIGIMNADGTISARNAKKYKQVNHLVELCRPVWARRREALASSGEALRIVDLACGNSYLSFVLLEALRLDGIEARLLGVDRREQLVATSEARAQQIGVGERARFVVGELEQWEPLELERELGGPVDLAISLHACDTATDAALALAIRAEVEAILCVPCCQAELARQLAEARGRARAEAAALASPAALEHGLLRRAYGDLLTDALRVDMLEACGYRVAVLEFVASSHTPKNLLLRASRVEARAPAQWQLEPIRRRCEALAVDPALLRALSQLQA